MRRIPIEELIGKRFGRLVIIREAAKDAIPNKWGQRLMECLCDCGNTSIATLSSLKNGVTKSCGCLQKENRIAHNLIGQKFGQLTVISKTESYISPKEKKSGRFLCKCDCGTETIVHRSSLLTGNTQSCGCILIEKVTVHNLRYHPLYRKWCGIKTRCNNPKTPCYKSYGGRGIKVCDEWLNDFMSFYNWSIANGWREGLEIDRINNDGNYSPDNCRYATDKQNARNRQTTVLTKEIVIEIRELRSKNCWGAKRISDHLKISNYAVEEVIYGNTWQ